MLYGGQDSRKFTLPGFPPPFPLVGVGTRLFLCFVISLLFATIYCFRQLISLSFRIWFQANCHPDLKSDDKIWKKCKLYLKRNYLPAWGAFGSNNKTRVKTKLIIMFSFHSSFSILPIFFPSKACFSANVLVSIVHHLRHLSFTIHHSNILPYKLDNAYLITLTYVQFPFSFVHRMR